ncbi:MAG: class I SAM-dependent methyltransferase [Candidatus Acidiferrales bacterium]
MSRDREANLTVSDRLILDYYRQVAATHGFSSRSSMEDDVVRAREVEWIRQFCLLLRRLRDEHLCVLDLGCGNGYTLSLLAQDNPQGHFWGVDFSQDLLVIASDRKIPNCVLAQGDARRLNLDDDFFDLVYTERCLINILDWTEQKAALREIARVLRRGGFYVMIECFLDGLESNNKARAECGLSAIKEAHHNKYLEADLFREAISDLFTIVDPSDLGSDGFTFQSNFLSSYYFVSRVLYPAIAKGEVARNSEIARFFSFLPAVGNYSPIQAYVLRKE